MKVDVAQLKVLLGIELAIYFHPPAIALARARPDWTLNSKRALLPALMHMSSTRKPAEVEMMETWDS